MTAAHAVIAIAKRWKKNQRVKSVAAAGQSAVVLLGSVSLQVLGSLMFSLIISVFSGTIMLMVTSSSSTS